MIKKCKHITHITIFLIIVLVVIISGVMLYSPLFLSKNINPLEKTTWIEIREPLLFHSGTEEQFLLTFNVPVLDVKPVSSLNCDISTSIEGNKVITNYFYDKNKDIKNVKLLDSSKINIYGIPLIVDKAVIKIKINKSDINSLKEYMNKQGEILYTDKNIIDFNGVFLRLLEPITGKEVINDFPFGDKPITEELINSVFSYLNTELNKNVDNIFTAYIKSNNDINVLAERINSEETTIKGKAVKIAEYVCNNTMVSDENIPESIVNLNYIWAQKKGNCVSRALLIKTMLDHIGIENKIVYGYVIFSDNSKALHTVNDFKEDGVWKRINYIKDSKFYENSIINTSDIVRLLNKVK